MERRIRGKDKGDYRRKKECDGNQRRLRGGREAGTINKEGKNKSHLLTI